MFAAQRLRMAGKYVPFTVPTIAVRQVGSQGPWQPSGSNPVTFGSNVASTEAVLAFVFTEALDTPSVSGCGITAFSQIATTEGASTNSALFLGLNSAGGSATLTVDAPTTNQWGAIAFDISGPLVGAPVQVTSATPTWSGGSTGSTQSAPTMYPTQVGDLMVAVMIASTGSTINPPSGWTAAQPNGSMLYAYRLATSTDVANGATVSWTTPAAIYVNTAICSVVLR